MAVLKFFCKLIVGFAQKLKFALQGVASLKGIF
jgi:hypothetical protein